LERYLTTKGAFLSNLFEIYRKIGYKPNKEYSNVSEMITLAENTAKASKARANEILRSSSVSKIVRREIKEMGATESLSDAQVAQYVVKKRRNAVALDSMMLEAALSPRSKKVLKDWEGKVLLDAHKILRDSLLDISVSV
jgi:hypothetical protein